VKIVVVHFHLNRGGVTQVVLNHLRALDRVVSSSERLDVLVLHGGQANGWPSSFQDSLENIDVTMGVVEGLAYDAEPQARSHELHRQLRASIDAAEMLPSEAIIHFHNHNLGKNCSLPQAIQLLSNEGFGCLLQIHDFAEDFRPNNYRHLVDGMCPDQPALVPRQLYFFSARIKFAFLNQRDQSILAEAGLPPSHAVSLPNPIGDFGHLPDENLAREKFFSSTGHDPSKRILLYPVRGIRRKNLGEALLWSALLRDQAVVATTLAPENPVELPSYLRWKRFASEAALPFDFEVGEHSPLTFPEVLSAADAILTTSIAEGFGLAFLESWLIGKPVIGRDLEEITEDFKAAGVDLSGVYQTLPVPMSWLPIENLYESLRAAIETVRASYPLDERDDAELDREINSLVVDDHIDFALISSELQRAVIRRVLEDAESQEYLLKGIAPQVFEDASAVEERVRLNEKVITENFSLQQTGRRLLGTYESLIGVEGDCAVSNLDRDDIVLSRFLQLKRMHLIRFE